MCVSERQYGVGFWLCWSPGAIGMRWVRLLVPWARVYDMQWAVGLGLTDVRETVNQQEYST